VEARVFSTGADLVQEERGGLYDGFLRGIFVFGACIRGERMIIVLHTVCSILVCKLLRLLSTYMAGSLQGYQYKSSSVRADYTSSFPFGVWICNPIMHGFSG